MFAAEEWETMSRVVSLRMWLVCLTWTFHCIEMTINKCSLSLSFTFKFSNNFYCRNGYKVDKKMATELSKFEAIRLPIFAFKIIAVTVI